MPAPYAEARAEVSKTIWVAPVSPRLPNCICPYCGSLVIEAVILIVLICILLIIIDYLRLNLREPKRHGGQQGQDSRQSRG